MTKISQLGVTVADPYRGRSALDRRSDEDEAAVSGRSEPDLERLARLLRVGRPAPSGAFVRAFERSLLEASRRGPAARASTSA